MSSTSPEVEARTGAKVMTLPRTARSTASRWPSVTGVGRDRADSMVCPAGLTMRASSSPL